MCSLLLLKDRHPEEMWEFVILGVVIGMLMKGSKCCTGAKNNDHDCAHHLTLLLRPFPVMNCITSSRNAQAPTT